MPPADSTLARYLAAALPHLPDMITLNDPDGLIRLVTYQSKNILGRRPSDMIGRDPYEWIHPDDQQMVRRKYHQGILNGASVQGRYRLRHEQGHYIWLDFVGVPLFQDPDKPRAVTAIFTLCRDATPWVEAESAAKERLNHLTLMQDLAELAWFTYDLKTGVVQHNDAFVEFTGQAASAFTKLMDWKRLVYPADRKVLHQGLLKLWKRATPQSHTVELRLETPGRRLRWVRMSLSLMKTGTPGGERVYGVLLDIDEWVRSREQSQRWIQQRERIGQRERQDIAHELHDEVGQILTGLRWQLEAAQFRIRGGDWPARPEDLPMDQWLTSLDQAHHTLRAIAHRLRPPLAALGLRAALHKLAEEYAQLWLGDTRLELALDDVLPDGDEWRVNNVLGIVRESLNNVARHARASCVRVKASASPEGLLRVLVQDDGVGMDVRQAQSGETLGLTSLYERARLVGGRLSIDSVPDNGTEVSLELWMKRTDHEPN